MDQQLKPSVLMSFKTYICSLYDIQGMKCVFQWIIFAQRQPDLTPGHECSFGGERKASCRRDAT